MLSSLFVLSLASSVFSLTLPRGGAAIVYSSCKAPKTVALTFDDGPYLYTNEIVDTLDAAGAVGTFFVNGNNYGCIYANNGANVKYMFDHGHQVASHTWSHPDLTTLSHDAITSELTRVNDALRNIIGVTPAFVRPPYGNYNDEVREVAGALGQALVLWDFDSGDSTGSTPEQSEAAYTDLLNKNPQNVIALNHETHETTANELIPWVVNFLKKEGYAMVSVADCLGLPPYLGTQQPSQPDNTWQC